MKPPFNPDELYKVEEIAPILKVSLKTVYRLLENNKVPFTQVGGQYRVQGQGINNYLSEGGTIGYSQPVTEEVVKKIIALNNINVRVDQILKEINK